MNHIDDAMNLGAALAAEAAASRQRRLLALAGSAAWVRGMAERVVAGTGREALWLSTAAPPGTRALHGKPPAGLLGAELAGLVVDAHAGFDPDAVGAASGAVTAGGLVLWLVPPLSAWPTYADPEHARLAVWPHGAEAVGGRFLARLARELSATTDVTCWCEGAPAPAVAAAAAPVAMPEDGLYRTADQREAVAAVRRVVSGHRRRPAVLIADRGRGKSAALGIAAAQLLAEGRQRVLVTAPRREAAQAVFAMAAQLLPGAAVTADRVAVDGGELRFIAPDALIREPAEADLLLVDEAAAIPAPLLARLLERYSRIAFATTVHGYEGTGRGFLLRFGRVLDARTPGWHAVRLETPVRFAAGDPVERFTFRALGLDAEPAEAGVLAAAAADACRLREWDRDRLAADEARLGELFGLLVTAHYRTRPFDLRHLLDGPSVRVFAFEWQGLLAATALVAAEGGFPPDLATAIAAGRRRPRGHLIAQSLAAHGGIGEAPGLHGWRVVRIAVHPAVQGRGIGSALLGQLTAAARAAGADWIGASFGLETDVLRFWRRSGFSPVRVGVSHDAAGGGHAGLVLQALSEAGVAMQAHARRRFLAGLPAQLAEPLADLDPTLAADLLFADGAAAPEADDLDDVQAFAFGRRDYATCIGALWRFTARALGDETLPLDAGQRALLARKVMQRAPWPQVAAELGLAGRAAAESALREAVAAAYRNGR
jgi:tRNA(Met) cytidine acetyltransferase